MRYFLLGKEDRVNLPHLILACWYDCNLKCSHCYNLYQEPTIAVEKWEAVIEGWANYCTNGNNGNGIVHFKGGEPFLPKFSKTLMRLVEKVKEKGLKLFFTTNGTFLPQVVEKLTEWKPDLVIVSLNGPSAEIDQGLRQKGVFERTVAGIKSLKKHEVPFAINYVVCKGSEKHIFQMAQLTQELGGEQLNLLPLVKRGGALKEELQIPDFEVTLRQLEQTSGNGLSRLMEWSILDLIQRIVRGEHTCEGCPVGYKGLAYITPDGKIYSCPNTVIEEYKLGEIGDVFQKGFDAIFQSKATKKVREAFTERLVCEGELLHYQNSPRHLQELEKAETLIRERISQTQKPEAASQSIAVCFNRNW